MLHGLSTQGPRALTFYSSKSNTMHVKVSRIYRMVESVEECLVPERLCEGAGSLAVVEGRDLSGIQDPTG